MPEDVKPFVDISPYKSIDPEKIEAYEIGINGEKAIISFYMQSGNKFNSLEMNFEYVDEFIEAVLQKGCPLDVLKALEKGG